jgi:hypothetical protein
VRVNSNWRSFAGVSSGLFFAGTIVWLVLYGRPENSLHASAMSWSFCGLIGILVSVGFSEILTVALPKVSVNSTTVSATKTS